MVSANIGCRRFTSDKVSYIPPTIRIVAIIVIKALQTFPEYHALTSVEGTVCILELRCDFAIVNFNPRLLYYIATICV